MPYRAKHHFYLIEKEDIHYVKEFVSMPYRAKHHFYISQEDAVELLDACVNALSGETSFLQFKNQT